MVVVEQHDLTPRQPSGHDVVGREDGHRRIGRDRHDMQPRHAIGPPVRSGRDADMLKPEIEDLARIKPAVEIALNIRPLRQLIGTVIRDPAPGRQAGQQPFPRDAPAQLRSRLGQRHVIATQRQGARRLKPRRSRADDQHRPAVPPGVHLLRVPALAPFLHEGRVLGAARDRHGHVASDADVAADAFADVLDPAVLHLLRQERIGDGGPRAADEVQHPLPHQPRHEVGRGEAADTHHRLRSQLANAGDQRLLRRLFLEAARA